MRYETVGNLQLPKLGFGTWKIGGSSVPDPSLDEWSTAALRSALSLGYTHFDTAEGYAGGHAEALLGRVVREVGAPRESLFITSKVSPDHLRGDDVLRSCAASLERLGMDYLDLYLIHWPNTSIPQEQTFPALNRLVREGRVRHLGVSNFNLKQLKKAAALSETPLLTNQVSYSLPDRTSVENGVLAYCQENDILVTAYSPVKHRNTASNPVLMAIAQERGLTRQQVALAWLMTQPRVITIPMSGSPRHQQENLLAADIVLTDDEMRRLDHSLKRGE